MTFTRQPKNPRYFQANTVVSAGSDEPTRTELAIRIEYLSVILPEEDAIALRDYLNEKFPSGVAHSS